jgi:hypothetical protein
MNRMRESLSSDEMKRRPSATRLKSPVVEEIDRISDGVSRCATKYPVRKVMVVVKMRGGNHSKDSREHLGLDRPDERSVGAFNI